MRETLYEWKYIYMCSIPFWLGIGMLAAASLWNLWWYTPLLSSLSRAYIYMCNVCLEQCIQSLHKWMEWKSMRRDNSHMCCCCFCCCSCYCYSIPKMSISIDNTLLAIRIVSMLISKHSCIATSIFNALRGKYTAYKRNEQGQKGRILFIYLPYIYAVFFIYFKNSLC